MKIYYLLTCGDRNHGFNPRLTAEGTDQISGIRRDLLPNIPRPPMIVVGTGARFGNTYAAIAPLFQNVPMKYSPLCGTGEATDKDGNIELASGVKVPKNKYISIESFSGIAWEFIMGLQPGTLLCAGEELMHALGFPSAPARLYEIDTDARAFRSIKL
jgi:hypothetical protein